jgi:hypothetical protein
VIETIRYCDICNKKTNSKYGYLMISSRLVPLDRCNNSVDLIFDDICSDCAKRILAVIEKIQKEK